MLSEWLPFRDLYISEVLDQEQPPSDLSCSQCHSEGLLRCKDCFSGNLLCQGCCLIAHRNTPFHTIERWTGQFFQSTSLHEEGFTLYLGHRGAPCPGAGEENVQASGVAGEGTKDKGTLSETWKEGPRKCLIVVDISGAHQLHIGWCQCKDAPAADVQLLRSRLFPASISNPSTAFTFGALEHFHIDSVECKTSALSFFSKLRRLTNNTNPDSVPVSLIFIHPNNI